MSKQRGAFEAWWDTIFAVEGKSYAWMAWQEAQKQQWIKIDFSNPETWPDMQLHVHIVLSKDGEFEQLDKLFFADGYGAEFLEVGGIYPEKVERFQGDIFWCYAPVFKGAE